MDLVKRFFFLKLSEILKINQFGRDVFQTALEEKSVATDGNLCVEKLYKVSRLLNRATAFYDGDLDRCRSMPALVSAIHHIVANQ